MEKWINSSPQKSIAPTDLTMFCPTKHSKAIRDIWCLDMDKKNSFFNETYNKSIELMNEMILQYEIKSLVDILCGTLNTGKTLLKKNLSLEKYVGIDPIKSFVNLCNDVMASDSKADYHIYSTNFHKEFDKTFPELINSKPILLTYTLNNFLCIPKEIYSQISKGVFVNCD